MKIKIKDCFFYYDGPLLVGGTDVANADRHFIMTTLDFEGNTLAVEVSVHDYNEVAENRLELRPVFTTLRIGPYYAGKMADVGFVAELAEHVGDVSEDDLPGDVTIALKDT